MKLEILHPEPTLVAREAELQALEEQLKGALNGSGRTVFIAGEAGIGKTRLAKELMTRANTSGMKVLYGRSIPHNLTPYLVFIDALEELFSLGKEEAKLAKLVNDEAKELGIKGWLTGPRTAGELAEQEIEPKAWREKLFESVAQFLLRTSKHRPILMVLEDLQWADPSSIGLLHYIARNIQTTHALLLCTYRTEELEEVTGGTSTLLDTLRLMRVEGLLREIPLDRLSLGETSRLVKGALQGAVPSRLAEILYQESEGNPLFVLEALRLLVQDGVLVARTGTWELRNPIERLRVPERVQEIILRRLEKLSATHRGILDCACVIGDPFPSELLEKILKIERMELLWILGDLEKKYHLIHYDREGYHFDHSKIREALYQEMSEELRRQYHLETAQNLEALHLEDPEAYHSAMGYHYEEGGNLARALEHYRAAAEDAAARGEFEGAQLLIENGLRVSGDSAGVERGRLELVRSYRAEELGLTEEARIFGENALHIFQTLGDIRGEAQAQKELGSLEISSPAGDISKAESYLKAALQKSESLSDSELILSIRISLAHMYAYSRGNLPEAQKQIAAIEATAKSTRDIRKRRSLLMLKAWIDLRLQGNYPAAEANFSQAMALARTSKDTLTVMSAKYGLAFSAYYQGQFSEARRVFEQVATEMMSRSIKSYGIEALCTSAECYLLEGDVQGFQATMTLLDNIESQNRLKAHLAIIRSLEAIRCILTSDQKSGRTLLIEAKALAEKDVDVERKSYAFFLCGVANHVQGYEEEAAMQQGRAETLLRAFGRMGMLSNFDTRWKLLTRNIRDLMMSP